MGGFQWRLRPWFVGHPLGSLDWGGALFSNCKSFISFPRFLGLFIVRESPTRSIFQARYLKQAHLCPSCGKVPQLSSCLVLPCRPAPGEVARTPLKDKAQDAGPGGASSNLASVSCPTPAKFQDLARVQIRFPDNLAKVASNNPVPWSFL